MHGTDNAPVGHPQRWLILGILCICLVLIVASVSSLNIAIPTIQESLDASQTQLQWIIDAYALVFAGLLLPAGALGDRFGRKWTLLIGLGLYGVAAIVASTSNSANQLIVMRSIMGIGAAFIMPSTLSLLTSVFPPHERPRAIAVWAGFAGAGGALGVVASGVLLEHFWWGSVFFITVPIIAVAMIGIAAIVPSSRDDERHPLDPIGSLLSIAGLVSLVYAIIEGPESGWSHVTVVFGFVAAAVLLVGFVVWELRSDHPMLDPRYFRIGRFRMGAMTITIAFFAMFGMLFELSQLFQFVRGYSPLRTGIAIVPFAATFVLIAPQAVKVQQRLSVRRTIALGLTLMSAGLFGLAFIRPDHPYLLIALAVCITSAGSGFANPSATMSIMSSLPSNKAGVGSAVNDTTREVGGAVGIAVVGSVAASAFRASVDRATNTLPVNLRAGARDNVGAAVTTGRRQLGADPSALDKYLHEVGRAFTNGLNISMAVAAVLALLGAGAVMRWYPHDTHLGEQARMPTRSRVS
jgi:EmrB/QacA subfamily drug resistance transporter